MTHKGTLIVKGAIVVPNELVTKLNYEPHGHRISNDRYTYIEGRFSLRYDTTTVPVFENAFLVVDTECVYYDNTAGRKVDFVNDEAINLATVPSVISKFVAGQLEREYVEDNEYIGRNDLEDPNLIVGFGFAVRFTKNELVMYERVIIERPETQFICEADTIIPKYFENESESEN